MTVVIELLKLAGDKTNHILVFEDQVIILILNYYVYKR